MSWKKKTAEGQVQKSNALIVGANKTTSMTVTVAPKPRSRSKPKSINHMSAADAMKQAGEMRAAMIKVELKISPDIYGAFMNKMLELKSRGMTIYGGETQPVGKNGRRELSMHIY
jgi:hypothetical protein